MVQFMIDTCTLPAFSTDHASRIVHDLYGIKGTLSSLNGERDLNFLVTTDRDRFVFKIANNNETYSLLECQHQVLERLAADQVTPQQASSVISLSGKAIETTTDENGIEHYCRVLHYVEGRLLSQVDPHPPELLIQLGQILARLDRSLQTFNHGILFRPFIWNMFDALATLERFKPLLESNNERELVERFEFRFRNTVLPSSKNLRRAVIHNDANDNNIIIVSDSLGAPTINSIIDFGDMAYSWLAVEPSVASAYAMMGKDNPLDAAVAIVQGYHEFQPLNTSEVRVLFDLICMRLCMSVCICAHQKSTEPDNEYLKISELPAWNLLKQFNSVSQDFAHQVFRDACSQ